MKFIRIHLLLILSLLLAPQHSEANVLDFLFGAGSFGRKAGTTADCRNIFQRISENRKFFKDETWKNRVVLERTPKFLNDLDYLEEQKYAGSTLIQVDTRFLKEFDTRFYYTATAKPSADGTIPMVDPEAKALVIYFHGSGTMKASGVGFAGKMNPLAKLGYSSVSFDLPFHRDGSRNPALSNTKDFADYIESIVQKLKVPGQPVILAGHSFGPDLIAEYITRYPNSVDSAVLISPGGFDEVTAKWYEEKTAQMDFGDTESNDMGGRWAALVTTENTWNKVKTPDRVDPTKANPNLKVYVVSGDREEYVPGELGADGKPTTKPREYDVAGAFGKFFNRVDVTIEPGVGHYIFGHQDAQGQDVVLRSILKANNESLLDEKEIKKQVSLRMQNRPSYDTLALRYSKEPFFRDWMDEEAKKMGTTSQNLIAQFVKNQDKKEAQTFITKFTDVEKQRVDALNENIKATEKWAPAFYEENKAAIDALGTRGVDQTNIRAKYLAYLKTLPEDVVNSHAVSSPAVYVIPERAPRPDPQNFRQGQQQNKGPSEATAP